MAQSEASFIGKVWAVLAIILCMDGPSELAETDDIAVYVVTIPARPPIYTHDRELAYDIAGEWQGATVVTKNF